MRWRSWFTVLALAIWLVTVTLVPVSAGQPLARPEAQARVTQDGGVTLTLLHNNDGESSLLPLTNAVTTTTGVTTSLPVGSVAAFKTLTKLSKHCRICAGKSPFASLPLPSKGGMPDTKMRFPVRTACAIGDLARPTWGLKIAVVIVHS